MEQLAVIGQIRIDWLSHRLTGEWVGSINTYLPLQYLKHATVRHKKSQRDG
jgi:hypothetical protein